LPGKFPVDAPKPEYEWWLLGLGFLLVGGADGFKLYLAGLCAAVVGVSVWLAPGYLLGSVVGWDLNPADWASWVRAVAVLACLTGGSALATVLGTVTFGGVLVALD